jgi:hypothetical protein
VLNSTRSFLEEEDDEVRDKLSAIVVDRRKWLGGVL